MPRTSIFITHFFLVHYCMFVFVQSVLFVGLVKAEFSGLKDGFNVIHNFSLFFHDPYLISIYAILYSQLVYIDCEVWLTKDCARLNGVDCMFLPCHCIYVQQFVVIFGAMVFLIFNSITALVVLFIILKTAGELIGQSYGLNWLQKQQKTT